HANIKSPRKNLATHNNARASLHMLPGGKRSFRPRDAFPKRLRLLLERGVLTGVFILARKTTKKGWWRMRRMTTLKATSNSRHEPARRSECKRKANWKNVS